MISKGFSLKSKTIRSAEWHAYLFSVLNNDRKRYYFGVHDRITLILNMF